MLGINSIIEPGSVRTYTLANADGKTWILPSRDIATALELYQPSGIKGRVLKRWFPLVHSFGFVRDALHAEISHIGLRPDIRAIAEAAFGEAGLSFAIFGGTPSVHQKVTVQFFRDGRILGYMKLTDSASVASLFAHEQRLLATLSDAGLTGIPRCLFCQTLPDGTSVFVQSTVKTRRSASPHRWTGLHEDFLTGMACLTSARMLFDNTDFARSLIELKGNLGRIPEGCRDVIEKGLLSVLADGTGRTVEYSAFHADFTPWNMLVEEGRLFVFDWEYGRNSYPPMLDKYHFYVQQALHVAHLSPAEIHRKISTQSWYEPRLFACYLLDIISRFVSREPGELPRSLAAMLSSWTSMLKMLQ